MQTPYTGFASAYQPQPGRADRLSANIPGLLSHAAGSGLGGSNQ